MELDLAALPPREAHAWMIATILPRPIAWISTISGDGRPNLAPFSYFQAVSARPPLLLFVAANTRDGTPKDTLRNVREVPEFIVHLVPYAQAEAMNATAAPLPYGESEFTHAGVAASPATRVRPPRVAAAPVAFECALERELAFGDGPGAATVVFGRILHAHVRDDVLGPDGRPDPAKLDLIGRMGGEAYARTRELFTVRRPNGAP
ncbi:MAG: flavin reductase family protein [Verrucomicrobia bacterium]|nr:flavin reductase family protein [Verrucomicrobiota bacterium]